MFGTFVEVCNYIFINYMGRKRYTRKYAQHHRKKITHTLKSALKNSSNSHHTRSKKRVRFDL